MSRPMIRRTYIYACSQPNPGAWFQAKLNRIMAVMPTVAPRRSSSVIVCLIPKPWYFGAMGTEGRIKTERTASMNKAMAMVQNVQGHQSRDL